MLNFFFNSVNFDPVICVNTDETGEIAVSGSKDHSAIVWRLDNNENINFTLVGHSDYVVKYLYIILKTSCDFINQNVVATSSWDCSLRIWKLLE